jgi:hypothetical protein
MERPWEQVRPGIRVKLLPHEGELYVQAQSQERTSKERAMRRRQLRKLYHRLGELQKMKRERQNPADQNRGGQKGSRTGLRLAGLKVTHPPQAESQKVESPRAL